MTRPTLDAALAHLSPSQRARVLVNGRPLAGIAQARDVEAAMAQAGITFAGKIGCTTYIVTMPLPGKALSQNSRVHWTQRAEATKKARKLAAILTGAVVTEPLPHDKPVRIGLRWYGKTANLPDQANIPGWCKAYIDGIADSLGVNDRMFRLSVEAVEKDAKDPRLVVRITVG